jgi:hypothetical protein
MAFDPSGFVLIEDAPDEVESSLWNSSENGSSSGKTARGTMGGLSIVKSMFEYGTTVSCEIKTKWKH